MSQRTITVALALSLVVLAAGRLVSQEQLPSFKVEIGELPEAGPVKASARVLDARCEARAFHLSDDGRFAVAVEGAFQQPARFALWDLEAGKVLRYLSASHEKGTTPYTPDAADFGAQVDFPRGAQRFAFSTDNRLIAGLGGHDPAAKKDEIFIWERATGKLTQRLATANHHHHTFFFYDDKHLLTKAFPKAGVVIEVIDAETGDISYALGPVNFEMYGGCVHNRKVTFHSPLGMIEVDLKTKEQTNYKPAPPGASRFAATRTWISPDGVHLFVHKEGVVEVWGTDTRTLLYELKLADRGHEVLHNVDGMNLMAVRRPQQRKLDFVNLERGAHVSAIATSLPRLECAGISDSGQRLALGGEKGQLVIVDFPAGIPPGETQLDPLLRQAGGKVWR